MHLLLLLLLKVNIDLLIRFKSAYDVTQLCMQDLYGGH